MEPGPIACWSISITTTPATKEPHEVKEEEEEKKEEDGGWRGGGEREKMEEGVEESVATDVLSWTKAAQSRESVLSWWR